MSYIDEVLIHGARREAIDALNEWLREIDTERGQQFRQIDMGAAGGTKWYASEVWAAAFNHAPTILLEKLRDPGTWKNCVLSTFVIYDGEDTSEAFCFDGNKKDGWRPVVRQQEQEW